MAPTKVWEIRPNLLMIFWHVGMIVAIRNKIGHFFSVEPDWDSKLDCRWDCIQIEIDLKEGLQDEIELAWQSSFGFIESTTRRFPSIVLGVMRLGTFKPNVEYIHLSFRHFLKFRRGKDLRFRKVGKVYTQKKRMPEVM
jgi:hypothetical protein